MAPSRYEHASKRGVSAWCFYVLIGKLPLPDANTNRVKNALWSTSLFLSAWATVAQDSTVAKVGHRGRRGRRAAGGQRLNQQDKRGIRR